MPSSSPPPRPPAERHETTRAAPRSARRVLSLACLLAVLQACGTVSARAAEAVNGAGASFPAPAVEAWAARFNGESGSQVLFSSVGSAEGIRRVTAHAVDFALTDVPLTRAELEQDDLLQFPVIAGAVVPVVNLPGHLGHEVALTGPVLADIYLGKITRWNAPALRALNPHLDLPDLPIVPVHRTDGSGTSFVFTYYLSSVSDDWRDHLGIGSRLVWPTGSGAQGNAGVSDAVEKTAGAIGYVEYAYAQQSNLAMAALQNRAGRFVRASQDGVRSALASAQWSRPGYYEVLVNRAGESTWPIVGVSFVLMHQQQGDPARASEVLRFLDWAYTQGAEIARSLHYIPLEDAGLIGRIESSWSMIVGDDHQPVWKASR